MAHKKAAGSTRNGRDSAASSFVNVERVSTRVLM